MKKINHWINGKNVAGNDYFQTTNPATGEVLAEVASGGEAEVNQAVAAAKEAFPKWANLPMKERARLMRRLGDLIDQNVPEIAAMETADTGLPIHQTKNVLIPRASHNMMKNSVAMLAVCMLAQSHLAIAVGAPAPQEIKIVLLGTKGGPSLLNTARLPQATALTIGDKIWLIDAGYGASLQLVKNGIPLRSINTILLTHLHSDHILDYPSLLMNAWASGLKDHTIQVYGPPGTQAMTKASWKVFDRDITLRMEEEGKPDPRNLVKATDIGQGVIYKDELVTISALKVPHSPFPDGEAFAYRFDTQGKRIVFSGDTSWFPPLATFAQGADILVHEAVHVPSVAKLANSIGNGKTLAEAIASHHTTIEDVGKIAREAHVKKLVLSHLVPATVADDVWQQEAMKNYPGPVIVGHDNMTLSVP